MRGWIPEGCVEEVIDWGHFGEVPGYRCVWRRREVALERYREETFYSNGTPHLVTERLEDGVGVGRSGRVYFEEGGELRYRVMEDGDEPGTSYLEVVDGGQTVSVYRSNWGSAAIQDNAEIFSLPWDLQLAEGMPWLEVEMFHIHQQQRELKRLVASGIDSRTRSPIHFGIYFPPSTQARAIEELSRARCTWENKETSGHIGPAPNHCLSQLPLELDALQEMGRVVGQIALDLGGRYYGWSHIERCWTSAN
jgi:hypothetical protein